VNRIDDVLREKRASNDFAQYKEKVWVRRRYLGFC
jgi:hypothetical protein